METVKLNSANIIKMIHYISSVALPVHLISRGFKYEPGELKLTLDGVEADWDMILTNTSSIPAYLLFYAGVIGINNCNQDILKGITFSVGDSYLDLSIDDDSALEEGYFAMAALQSASVCSSDILRYNEEDNSLEASGLIMICVSTMEFLGIETNNSFSMGDIIKSRDLSKDRELSMGS